MRSRSYPDNVTPLEAAANFYERRLRQSPEALHYLQQRGMHSPQGSPAQVLQLQRQYGNQAVQRMIQRESAGDAVIQRVGINDQESYEQPNDVLGVTTDPIDAAKTPEAERNAQVAQLISHADLASADFKRLINGAIEAVNKEIKGGCTNGDKDFKHVTKTLASAVDKAKGRMEGGSVAQMKDVLRGTIKCKNVAALTKAGEFLDARAAQLMSMTEIKVGGTQKKDAFQPDKRKGPGNMVGYGREYLTRAPWIMLSPAAVIVLSTLSISIVGDWLRDRLDPTLR